MRVFYGWWIVGVGAVVAFSSGPGQTFVFSVFIDSLIEDTGLSRTAISTLYAVGTGVSAAMVFTVSRLADRYGARTTLIGAAIGLGLACIAMAGARGALMVFLAFAALRALGQGSLTINATLLVAQWFERIRGRAMAVMGLGFPIAVSVLPPAARFLIDTIGWRETYIVLGVMVWVLVLPGALFVVRERPEAMGLHPDGEFEPLDALEERPTVGEPRRPRVLTSLPFWALALPRAVPSLVVTGLIFHQVAIVQENGLSATVAANIFVAYAVASAAVSLPAGYLIDRLGPRPVFIVGLSVLVVAMGSAMVMDSLPLAVLYAVLIGIAGGVSQIVGSTTWAHYYGREGLGPVQGTAMMVGITASALGPLPFAWLQAEFDGFRPGIALIAVLPLAGILVEAFAPHPVPASASRVR